MSIIENKQYLFRAKTSEGCVIKVLFELLKNIKKEATLEIDDEYINLKANNNSNNILIFLSLRKDKFNEYTFNSDKTLFVGLNLNQLYTSISETKKKDSIIFYIESKDPSRFVLEILPREHNKRITTSINTFTLQHINIPIPSKSNNYVVIQSDDYQRIIKNMLKINKENKAISIHMKEKSILLKLNNDITPKEIVLGELNDTSLEHYSALFNLELLTKVLKISNLSSKIFIYSGSQTEPLTLKVDVGSLGYLTIYIKSNDQ